MFISARQRRGCPPESENGGGRGETAALLLGSSSRGDGGAHRRHRLSLDVRRCHCLHNTGREGRVRLDADRRDELDWSGLFRLKLPGCDPLRSVERGCQSQSFRLPVDGTTFLVGEGQQVRSSLLLLGAVSAQFEQFGAKRLLLGFELRNQRGKFGVTGNLFSRDGELRKGWRG